MRYSASRRHAVIVLGMHRSGTSALAGVLARLGARAPAHLMPADENNERGYFESSRMMEFHEQVLALAGSSWSSWRPIDERWMETREGRELVTRLQELIHEEFGDAELLLVKDPRMCRLMSLWRASLSELAIEAHVVLPVRDPAEVVASLSARDRDRVPPVQAKLAWLRNVLDAESGSRGLDRVFCSYADLLTDWRGQVANIGKHLGISWTQAVEDAGESIDDYLSPGLRHHVATAGQASGSVIDSWVELTFDALSDLVGDPDAQAPLAVLDTVRGELDREGVTGGGVPGELETDLLRDVRGLAVQLSDALEDRARMEAEHRSAMRELASKMNRQVRQLNAERRRLEDSLQERFRELAVLGTRVVQLESLESERVDGRVELMALREEVTILASIVSRRRSAWRRWTTRTALSATSPPDELEADRQLLRSSRLWTPGWYLRRNPDVRRAGVNAALHYLTRGAREGRDPGPAFSTSDYLRRNPDVARSGTNPLVHYLRHGRVEGRPMVLPDAEQGGETDA